MSSLIQETFTITIQFFGAFRNFSHSFDNANHIELICEPPCSIAQVREALKQRLKACCPLFNEALLDLSVFANEQHILSETTPIDQSMQLMILPPISGG